MIIKGFNVTPLYKKTLREIRDDRVLTLAAGTAYYFFFSLFPLLLFLTPLLGLLGNGRELMESLLGHLSQTLPPDALSLIRRVLTEIITSDNGPGVMSIGLLLAAWSGSSIFGALMEALNVAYDVEETRPWWKQQVLRLACLLVSALAVFASTSVFLSGNAISRWIGHTLGLGDASIAAWSFVQSLIAVCILVGLCVMLFKLLPNVRQRWTHVIIAALVTTALWLVATLLFRLYVSHFGAYNKTYGTIGGVILLLSWMYYSMVVLLSGGELAAEMHHGTGAIDPLKGAIYLGRIVSEEGPGTASMEKVKPSR
jgi:membrane protein